MEIKANGLRYVFQWEHVYGDEVSEQRAQEHITAAGLAYKPQRYMGMTICRLKTPGPDGKLVPASSREGVALCRADEDHFDRRTGRKYALQSLLRLLGYGHDFNRKAWDEFNKQWPPLKAEMSLWQKRYIKAAMDATYYKNLSKELHERLEKLSAKTNLG